MDDRPKFHSASSSAALAVNVFGPWLDHDDAVLVAGQRLAVAPQFESKCPTGLEGQPPNLDVLFAAKEHVVAIESKCTEHLTAKAATYAAGYNDLVAGVAHPSWGKAFELTPKKRHLDTAQLVKHYLGLKKRFADGPAVTLLYLFLEPPNWWEMAELCEHRRELDAFDAVVNDPVVRFQGMSYPELWAIWSTDCEVPWMPAHIAQLRARYGRAW